MQTSVSVGQDGRFHQMSACQKKWMEMRTPSSFLHYCSLFQPPRLFLFTQQRTENTHISKEIVSYFWQDITRTQSAVLIFGVNFFRESSFKMAFSSIFKAVAFLAVVTPAQSFAPASLGGKTVRSTSLVFVVSRMSKFYVIERIRFWLEIIFFLWPVRISEVL